MVRIVTFLAAVALASLPAMAGDIYQRGDSIKDAPAVIEDAPFSWTGVSVGGDIGYGLINREIALTVEGKDEAPDYEIGRLRGLGGEGLIGGVNVGADYQVGRIVARTRFDYSFSDIETAASLFSGEGRIEAAYQKQDEWMAWGGLGVTLAPRTLLYVLAGYGETTYKVESDNAALSDVDGYEQDYQGYGGAVGLEHAISRNVSLKLEGQYIVWDKVEHDIGHGLRLDDEADELRIKGGVNFRLGVEGISNPLE